MAQGSLCFFPCSAVASLAAARLVWSCPELDQITNGFRADGHEVPSDIFSPDHFHPNLTRTRTCVLKPVPTFRTFQIPILLPHHQSYRTFWELKLHNFTKASHRYFRSHSTIHDCLLLHSCPRFGPQPRPCRLLQLFFQVRDQPAVQFNSSDTPYSAHKEQTGG
jgi:hypothetical protein